MGLAKRSGRQRYCYGNYLLWQDDACWELIDGIAYAMTPALSHQAIALGIASQALNAVAGSPCRVLIAPLDVRLPSPGQDGQQCDTAVQPDVLAVCNQYKLSERGVLVAPDWIVLLPRSASHDNIPKRRLYEQAGVREFWLVHPGDRLLFIYRLNDCRYGKPEVVPLVGSTPVGVLHGVTIDWSPIIDLLPAIEP